MKPMGVGYTCLALLLLLLAASWMQSGNAASAFCDGKCNARCARARSREPCLRYCGLCCEECNCVPSGTYGHKDECPCYRDMLTTGPRKRPKCP